MRIFGEWCAANKRLVVVLKCMSPQFVGRLAVVVRRFDPGLASHCRPVKVTIPIPEDYIIDSVKPGLVSPNPPNIDCGLSTSKSEGINTPFHRVKTELQINNFTISIPLFLYLSNTNEWIVNICTISFLLKIINTFFPFLQSHFSSNIHNTYSRSFHNKIKNENV